MQNPMGGSLAWAACDWLRAECSLANHPSTGWLILKCPLFFPVFHPAVINSNSHIGTALIHFSFQTGLDCLDVAFVCYFAFRKYV